MGKLKIISIFKARFSTILISLHSFHMATHKTYIDVTYMSFLIFIEPVLAEKGLKLRNIIKKKHHAVTLMEINCLTLPLKVYGI